MRSGREPKFRVAWGRPGWFRDTSEWMCEILRSHGLEVEGRAAEIDDAEHCAAGENREGGSIFLKCTPAFCNEAAIT